MVTLDDPVEVEFACDNHCNHRAPVHSCTEAKVRKFSSLTEAIPFIEECSYVYNVDELMQNVPLEKVPVSLRGKVCTALTLD